MEKVDHIIESKIRKIFDEKTKQWYFSVVDVIAVISQSSDPRNYWKVLKSRLHKTNPQLVTTCNQLKLPSSDGKSYSTDVATSDTLLKVIELISIADVKAFRLWFEKIEISSHLEKSFPQEEGHKNPIELPIDVYQKGGLLIIEAFIPGTNPEDITICATHENITIEGLRKIAQSIPKEDFVIQELFYGSFSRTIIFSIPVELDRIESSITHGFLTISIPLIDTKRIRIIKIKSL